MNRLTLCVILVGSIFSPAAASDHDDRCRKNLEYLADAIKAYKLVHEGKGPEKLSDLYYEGYADDIARYRCPGGEGARLQRTEIDEKSDYTLAPLPGQKEVVVRERKPRGGNTVLAALQDGTIKSFSPTGDDSVVTRRDDTVPTTRPIGGEGVTVTRRDDTVPTTQPVEDDEAGKVIAIKPIDGDLDVFIQPRGHEKAKITGNRPGDDGGNLEDTGQRQRTRGSVSRGGGIEMQPSDMIALADMIAEKGGYDAALDQYEKALEADPNNEQALFGHGRSSMYVGSMRLARMRFQSVLKINPTHAEARRLLAMVDLMLGQTQAAVDTAKKLRDDFPRDPRVELLYAQAALYKGDKAEAAACFAAIAKAQPKLSAESEEQADAYLAQRLFNLALLHYRTAYALDPSNTLAQLNTGEVAAKLGQKPLAIEMFESYLRKHPDAEASQYTRDQLQKLRQK